MVDQLWNRPVKRCAKRLTRRAHKTTSLPCWWPSVILKPEPCQHPSAHPLKMRKATTARKRRRKSPSRPNKPPCRLPGLQIEKQLENQTTALPIYLILWTMLIFFCINKTKAKTPETSQGCGSPFFPFELNNPKSKLPYTCFKRTTKVAVRARVCVSVDAN